MRTTHRNKPDFRLQPIVIAVHLALAGAAMADPAQNALPTGGQVVSGQATIQQQGGSMDIQQGTPRAALDWQTFNIGAHRRKSTSTSPTPTPWRSTAWPWAMPRSLKAS